LLCQIVMLQNIQIHKKWNLRQKIKYLKSIFF